MDYKSTKISCNKKSIIDAINNIIVLFETESENLVTIYTYIALMLPNINSAILDYKDLPECNYLEQHSCDSLYHDLNTLLSQENINAYISRVNDYRNNVDNLLNSLRVSLNEFENNLDQQ